MLQRKLQHLAFTVAVSAIATAGLTLAGTKPVLAEFEIQEAGIEKGEVEIEYRGAYHWGLPEVEDETRMSTLRQSHDFEMQMGITDWWMISSHARFTTVPAGFNWQVELRRARDRNSQLIKRHGNGIALSFATGYGWATRQALDTA